MNIWYKYITDSKVIQRGKVDEDADGGGVTINGEDEEVCQDDNGVRVWIIQMV